MARSRKPRTFSVDAMRRINRAVSAFERGNRDIPPVQFRDAGGDGDEPLRLCKTTAAWNKNTVATLNVWEDGTPPNESQTTGQTIEAVNKFANVAADKFCSVALHANGRWYLIAAEC